MEKGNGKTALITGATQGIGRELARLFAKDSYQLVIIARDEQQLNETAAELKSISQQPVTTIAIDLFDPRNAKAIFEKVKQKGLKIDVLVNDAGQGNYGLFLETDLQKDLDIIQLNVASVVALTKLFAKEMAANGGGKILNLSSIAGKAPGPYHSVYHGTKAFIQSFTEAIRFEFKNANISVTALLPGATDTDFFSKANMENAKIYDEDKLADPAKVAKDGYEALMAGKDMVVSGLKNKLQVAMAGVTPDDKLAANMAKQQEPKTK